MPKGKDKEKILKAAREKQIGTYEGIPIRLSSGFSKETLQAKRDYQELLKVMKSKHITTKITLSSTAII